MAKALLTARVLKLIKTIQNQPVELVDEDKESQSSLANMRVLSDDELYDLSAYLEPQEGQERPPRPHILDQFVQYGSLSVSVDNDVHHSFVSEVVHHSFFIHEVLS